MEEWLARVHTQSRAVLYAAYWSCLAALLTALVLLLNGRHYAGTQMIYTAFNVGIFSLLLCLGIELNEKMKGGN